MSASESDVLSAIDALERDEIGELVTWQIEQGRARGDGPDEFADEDDRELTEEECAQLEEGMRALSEVAQKLPLAFEKIGASVAQLRENLAQLHKTVGRRVS